MVRNSMRFVPWKDYKPVTADLKRIYQAKTEDEALLQQEAFEEAWNEEYPQIAKSWRSNRDNLNTFFGYPPAIRKAIYTTNAIESLNSVIRKATRQCKVFSTVKSALKVVYLAIMDASKKWSMPIHNWKPALNLFTILFGGRVTAHL
jgi:transposase-like protein